MAEASLGVAALRTRLDLGGLQQGLAQAKTDTQRQFTQLEGQLAPASRKLGNSLGSGISSGFDTAKKASQGFAQSTLADLRSISQGVVGFLGARGLVTALQQTAQEYTRASVGSELFARQLERNNQSVDEGVRVLESLGQRLGLVPEQISDSATQLLRQGLTMQEVSQLFEGAAASALAAGRTTQQGIEAVTSAVVNQSSIYLNYAGIAENLDVAYKDFAASVGKTTDELTKQEKAQAAVLLVQRATAEEVESLPQLLSGLTGAQNELTKAWSDFRLELGESVAPVVTGTVNVLTGALGILNQLPGPVVAAGAAAATAATGVIALAGAFTLLQGVLAPLFGPAGLIILGVSAVAALGAALATGKGPVDDYADAADRASEALKGVKDEANLDRAINQVTGMLKGDAKQAWIDYATEIRNAGLEVDETARKLNAFFSNQAEQQRALLTTQLNAKEAELARLEDLAAAAGDQAEAQEQYNRLIEEGNRLMEAGKEVPLEMTRQITFLEGVIAGVQGAGALTEREAANLTQRTNQLRMETASLRAEIEGLSAAPPVKVTTGDGGDVDAAAGSIAALQKELKGLNDEYDRTADPQRRAELGRQIKALRDQIDLLNRAREAARETRSSGKTFAEIMGEYWKGLDQINIKEALLGPEFDEAAEQLRITEQAFNSLLDIGYTGSELEALAKDILKLSGTTFRFRRPDEALQGELRRVGEFGPTAADRGAAERVAIERVKARVREQLELNRAIERELELLGEFGPTLAERGAAERAQINRLKERVQAQLEVNRVVQRELQLLGEFGPSRADRGADEQVRINRIKERVAAQQELNEAIRYELQLLGEYGPTRADRGADAAAEERRTVEAAKQRTAGRLETERELELLGEYGPRVADVNAAEQARINIIKERVTAQQELNEAIAYELQLLGEFGPTAADRGATRIVNNQPRIDSGIANRFGASGVFLQPFPERAGPDFSEEVEAAAAQFEQAVARAGVGFAQGLANSIVSGDIGAAFKAAFDFGGALGGAALSGVPGILLQGGLGLLGGLVGLLFPNDEAERRQEQARRDRARSVPAISISINQQNAFNYNGSPRDAGADVAMSRHAQTIAARIADAIVPRLERLEQRVATL